MSYGVIVKGCEGVLELHGFAETNARRIKGIVVELAFDDVVAESWISGRSAVDFSMATSFFRK